MAAPGMRDNDHPHGTGAAPGAAKVSEGSVDWSRLAAAAFNFNRSALRMARCLAFA